MTDDIPHDTGSESGRRSVLRAIGGGIGFTVLGGILSSVGRPNGTTGASSGAATTTATATAQAPDDWTSFMRDARNTGHNPEASGPTAAPAVRWSFSRKETDGKDNSFGFTAPTVVQDRVYLGGRNRLWAIDAEDGSTTWTHTFEAPDMQTWHNPAVDGEAVYTGGFSGDYMTKVVSLDTGDGSRLWTKPVSTIGSGGRDGETLYLTSGSQSGVHARNPDDGQHLWSYVDIEDVSAPAVVGATVYIGGATKVVALGPA